MKSRDKWLKNKALKVLVEMTSNTDAGIEVFEQFAEHVGRSSAEDVLFYMFKNVADHIEFCTNNPEVAEDINELRYHL
tara:strand:+ start:298 stop:531 length:234 start_codon:yes stop_codon:yes gene_type:complete